MFVCGDNCFYFMYERMCVWIIVFILLKKSKRSKSVNESKCFEKTLKFMRVSKQNKTKTKTKKTLSIKGVLGNYSP